MMPEITWAIFFLFLFFIGILVYDKIKFRRLKKKYDENENLSKQGELRRGSKQRETGFRIREPTTKDDGKPKRQGVLPTTDPNSSKQNSKRPRGIFRKRRRK